MKENLKSKESKENSKFNKKVIIFLLIIITLIVFAFIFGKQQGIFNSIIQTQTAKDTNIEEDPIQEVINISDIPNTMEDYKVLGTIVIDKLGITKNILNETTDTSLNLSVTKFYGPELNEQGNFCITGHNYKETFAYLDNLQLGDTFYIIDKAHSEKVTYKIYNKYTVNPNELDCLSQETEGKREVTLITCNPGAITRLIIKAREI